MVYSELKRRIGRIVGLSIVLTAAWFLAFHGTLPLIPAVQTVETNGRSTKLVVQNEVSAISLEEFLLLYQQGNVLLIDARQPADYQAGHIPGAVNIPYDQAVSAIDSLEKMTDKSIAIAYCDGADCMASIELAQRIAFVFEKVYTFFGGWDAWLEQLDGK